MLLLFFCPWWVALPKAESNAIRAAVYGACTPCGCQGLFERSPGTGVSRARIPPLVGIQRDFVGLSVVSWFRGPENPLFKGLDLGGDAFYMEDSIACELVNLGGVRYNRHVNSVSRVGRAGLSLPS